MNPNRDKIGWCDYTWNPITGCSPVSAGCLNCYARRIAEGRLRGRAGYNQRDPFRLDFHPDRLDEPAAKKEPSAVFVCSMSDFFHEEIRPYWRDQVFAAMSRVPQHTYLFLTKRRATCRLPGLNCWLGVTTENQAAADRRWGAITIHRQFIGGTFISAEPLLGPIQIPEDVSVDWIIAGPETGPGARPCLPAWRVELEWQARKRGVPFFWKGEGGPKEKPDFRNNFLKGG